MLHQDRYWLVGLVDGLTTTTTTTTMKKIYFLASHLFIGLFSLLLVGLMFQYNSLFSYHPVSMTLAFVLCMSEGVMASRYIKSKERAKYIQLHLVLQGSSVFFSLIGLSTIYYNKVLSDKPHLTSWHAWIGILVLVAHLSLTCVGLAMNYKRRSIIYYGGVPLYKRIATLHATCGNATHVLAMLVIALGFYSNYAIHTFAPSTIALIKALLVVLAILVQLLKPTATTSVSSGSSSSMTPSSSSGSLVSGSMLLNTTNSGASQGNSLSSSSSSSSSMGASSASQLDHSSVP